MQIKYSRQPRPASPGANKYYYTGQTLVGVGSNFAVWTEICFHFQFLEIQTKRMQKEFYWIIPWFFATKKEGLVEFIALSMEEEIKLEKGNILDSAEPFNKRAPFLIWVSDFLPVVTLWEKTKIGNWVRRE